MFDTALSTDAPGSRVTPWRWIRGYRALYFAAAANVVALLTPWPYILSAGTARVQLHSVIPPAVASPMDQDSTIDTEPALTLQEAAER